MQTLNSPKAALTSTASILEEINATLTSVEHSVTELRGKVSPILVQKNNACGEASLSDREEQSPLNEQLLTVLARLKGHNAFLINTSQQVTL